MINKHLLYDIVVIQHVNKCFLIFIYNMIMKKNNNKTILLLPLYFQI